jgi:zinc protease
LYPEAHPYSWTVIGSMDDLGNATVQDVRDFFTQWYGPNNATLVVAGDYDREETIAWIEKYFGEIPAAQRAADPTPMPVMLTETKRAYHEDNFARSPELNMIFPTVERYSEDSYALDMFGRLFSDGKKAPLYRVIVEEQKLAPSVSAYNSSRELTGEFRIRIRAFPGTSLSEVEEAIRESFARFETERFTERDLDRIKAQTETGFYNGISSVLGKGFQLASYNEFAGSPGFISEDIANSLAVSEADVWRVYDEYVKDKNFVLTSFVPRGGVDLVASGSELFAIEEESITQAGAGLEAGEVAISPLDAIPSNFDRSVEPAKGPAPTVTLPSVWTHTFDNGLRLFGVQHSELPLVQFSLTLKGGLLLDDIHKVGVANLMTDIMMEGTQHKTPLELEEAIDELGANISMSTGRESILIRANGLKSKVHEIYDLVEEILLEPRWDENEFTRIKDETIETINRAKVNPGSIASNVFNKLVYGENHILGKSTYGSVETVQGITLGDLRAFYEANYSPSVAHISVVGDITEAEAVELFAPLEANWAAKEVVFKDYEAPVLLDRSLVYFVDMPGARQSQIYVGHLGLLRSNPEYYAATVMNYRLGGSFNSVLNMILREEKGYTYGASSRITGGFYPGLFVGSSAVQANATLESAQIFKDEITRYQEGIAAEDLTFVQNALIQSNARRFETLGAVQGMLDQIANYDLPVDYVMRDQAVVQAMTLDEHRRLSQEYIHPDRMLYVIVGDAATQLRGLRGLGLGNPIRLDADGNRVR